MHQVCYNFWIKGRQPELMSTLGICPFSFSRLPWQHWFVQMVEISSLLCDNVTSHQKQGFCPGQGRGDKAQLGKCHLLGEQPCEKDALPASKQHCSLHSGFPRPHAEHSWEPDRRHLPGAAFGTWHWEGQRGCSGLWHKCGRMRAYTQCARAEIPWQCLEIRWGTRWLACKQHCWEQLLKGTFGTYSS